MNKHRILHLDEEDPGSICVLLRLTELNDTGSEESCSASVKGEEQVGWQGSCDKEGEGNEDV